MEKKEVREFYQFLGLKIKQARERNRKNLTQEKLGELINMSRTSIVNIEQGRHHIQVHTLVDISKILEVSINSLLPDYYNTLSTTLPFYTKSIDHKETKSLEKELSLIENRKVELNVSKNKKHY